MFQKVCVAETGSAHIATTGPLTGSRTQAMDINPFAQVLGATWETRDVVLDMAAAAYVDSVGVGWLLACVRQMREAGGSLVLYGLQSQVQEAFELMRLDSVLVIGENYNEAERLVA